MTTTIPPFLDSGPSPLTDDTDDPPSPSSGPPSNGGDSALARPPTGGTDRADPLGARRRHGSASRSRQRADGHRPASDAERRRVRNQLVEEHRRFAEHYVRRYANRGVSVDDLRQTALLALVQAADRFDPARGIEFTTFAGATIDGTLKRYFRDRTWSVRPPRRKQELHLKVRRAEEDLSQRLGRHPTVHELAGELGEGVDHVLEALEASSAHNAVSIDAPWGSADGQPVGESWFGSSDPNFACAEARPCCATRSSISNRASARSFACASEKVSRRRRSAPDWVSASRTSPGSSAASSTPSVGRSARSERGRPADPVATRRCSRVAYLPQRGCDMSREARHGTLSSSPKTWSMSFRHGRSSSSELDLLTAPVDVIARTIVLVASSMRSPRRPSIVRQHG